MDQDGAPCATEVLFGGGRKKKISSKTYFLPLLQCGGGKEEVKSCESLVKEKCGGSVFASRPGCGVEEESSPEIKQELEKTNSSNSHRIAAGEKSQRLLEPGKGPSSLPPSKQYRSPGHPHFRQLFISSIL